MLAAGIDHYRNLRGIPVMLVVFGELEIPVHLACVRIEREQRIAVEIVSRAPFTAIRGRRIACGPKNLVGHSVVGAGIPRGSAADLPRIALPGFMSGFARSRHGVEAPLALAGRGVISIDKPAHAVFTA